jgi:hypothetical protein
MGLAAGSTPKKFYSESNMHNRGNRNKRGGSRNSLLATPFGPRGTHSVKDMLARQSPMLTRVTDQAARQALLRDWMKAHLPEDISGKISGIVERESTLVLFAESAAWSARLRYAVLDIEARLRADHPGITAIKVRVLPRS